MTDPNVEVSVKMEGGDASPPAQAGDAATPAGAPDQLIVHGTVPAPRKKKVINLLNRSPSPVILEDYGDLVPSRCTVGGPGVAGGLVGVATQVTVTARDANGVRLREGGQIFKLIFQHCSNGAQQKTYTSMDHGDGGYSFTGIRAELKGMHKLVVEWNDTLVGDSPYLVMFEIDDSVGGAGDAGGPEDTDGLTGRNAALAVKEHILFVQHMHPEVSDTEMSDMFEKYGRLLKCERLLPAKDIWVVHFARVQDAENALELNDRSVKGCTIQVKSAVHVGGVGTHPLILYQLAHIQEHIAQEKESSNLAVALAQQRAAIRQSGGEVEELTDTRKKHKAVALMEKLRARIRAAKSVGDGIAAGSPPPRSADRQAAEVRPRSRDRDLRSQQGDLRSRGERERDRAQEPSRGRHDERAWERGQHPREYDARQGGRSRYADEQHRARGEKRPRDHEDAGRERANRRDEGGDRGYERSDRQRGRRDERDRPRAQRSEDESRLDRDRRRRESGGTRRHRDERPKHDKHRRHHRERGEEQKGGVVAADGSKGAGRDDRGLARSDSVADERAQGDAGCVVDAESHPDLSSKPEGRLSQDAGRGGSES